MTTDATAAGAADLNAAVHAELVRRRAATRNARRPAGIPACAVYDPGHGPTYVIHERHHPGGIVSRHTGDCCTSDAR